MTDEQAEIESIDRWLASTGFPIEYASLGVLERVGFDVDAGRFYRPVEGGPPREVDLVARTRGRHDTGSIVVRLVAECKYASSPWVVLTRSRKVTPAQLLGWTIATESAREILVGRAIEATRRSNQTGIPDWLTDTPDAHGSSIVTQPKGSKGGDRGEAAHDALLQVVDAAQGIAAETPESSAVAWPILIIRGPLYQARLDSFGQLKTEPIEWQRVIWGGVTGAPSVVDVVRERHLEAYARRAHEGLIATESALDAGYPS